MASIASKNLFDLLGDDAADPGQAPAPARNDKSSKGVQRGTAKHAHHEERTLRAGGRHRNEGVSGNEAAFRDRGAGSHQNRSRDVEPRGDYRSRGRGRGRGRGSRGGPPLDDRHSKTGVVDHEKQVGHGWGQNTGTGEWADEQAGEAIAKAEERADGEASAEDRNGDGNLEPAEEEPKAKTLDDYLAEQAEKRLQVSGSVEVRKANEGLSKKFPVGKEVNRNEDEEDFIAGTGGKKGRERAKKERNLVELDGEAMRQTDRNNDRRGGRGSRGRGGDFGARGRGRGDGGRARGEFRGGERGRGRGGRGGAGNAPNVADESAFPSLGS